MSVRRRLFLLYAGALALLMTLFSILTIYSLNVIFDQKIKALLKESARQIASDQKEFFIKPLYIQIWQKNRVIYKSTNLKQSLPLINKEFDQIDIPSISKNDESAVYKLIMKDRIIEVATPLYNIDDVLERFIAISIALGVVLYLFLLFIGKKIIDGAIDPLRQTLRTIAAINDKNLDIRIPYPKNKDEFYELAKTFNQMLDNLQKSYEKITRFNANVSHELKTPLTIAKGEIEVALRKERSNEEYKESLRSILEEIESMQEIIKNMLLLSKNAHIDKKPVALDTIANEVYQKKLPIANQKHIKLELHTTPITIEANGKLLKEAFLNVLDNAIKYTPQFGTIEIALYQKDGKKIFEVTDSGIGIEKKNLKKIFEPFFQEDESHANKGYGLGLSIVEWIVNAHDGSIKIQSQKGDGTTVSLLFY